MSTDGHGLRGNPWQNRKGMAKDIGEEGDRSADRTKERVDHIDIPDGMTEAQHEGRQRTKDDVREDG